MFKIFELNFSKLDGKMSTTIITCLIYMPKIKMFPKSCDNLKRNKQIVKNCFNYLVKTQFEEINHVQSKAW
jgi:hypothetical protein